MQNIIQDIINYHNDNNLDGWAIALAIGIEGNIADFNRLQNTEAEIINDNGEKMILATEHDENNQVDGWSYTIVDSDGQDITTGGDGIGEGETIQDLAESIATTILTWANA